MEFKLLNVCPSYGRLGIISNVERLPSFSLETPNLLFYTKRGCVPHLTYDVMQKLTKGSLALQFPLNNIFHCCDVMEKTGTSLNKYVGLPEYLSYCFTQDPTSSIPPGYHRGASVTIWSGQGKVFVPKERYMEIMEQLQPDMYCPMSDGDTNMNSSSKRLCNSSQITNSAFEYCYQKHNSSTLKNKGLIAPIEGGYDKMLRERCVKHMSQFSVLGYLIDGLYTNGKTVNNIPFQSVKEIVQYTTKLLPHNSLRIIHGAWSPKSILEMVKLGVDLFDTSFPYFITESGGALVFDYEVENILDHDVDLHDDCSIDFENCDNRSKTRPDSDAKETNNSLFLSLRNVKYFDDLNPIMENCTCLTCKNHTRSYIHHLLVSRELLAPILLTIHNLHHYMEFFKRIRQHLRKGCKNVVSNGF